MTWAPPTKIPEITYRLFMPFVLIASNMVEPPDSRCIEMLDALLIPTVDTR